MNTLFTKEYGIHISVSHLPLVSRQTLNITWNMQHINAVFRIVKSQNMVQSYDLYQWENCNLHSTRFEGRGICLGCLCLSLSIQH